MFLRWQKEMSSQEEAEDKIGLREDFCHFGQWEDHF